MTPLMTCAYEMRIASPSAVLNTLHVLLRKASDVIDEDGLYLLKCVMRVAIDSMSVQSYKSILKFVFEFLNNNLKTCLERNSVHEILLYDYWGRNIEYVMFLFRGYIDAEESVGPYELHRGYTVLHKSVASLSSSDLITALVINGARLHLPGVDYQYSDRRETPTSLAIRWSGAFFKWKTALTVAGIDLTQFVQNEMEAGILEEQGWSANALLELFSREFEPFDDREPRYCGYCKIFLYWVGEVETRWMNMIKDIRQRHIQASKMPSASSSTSLKEDVRDKEEEMGSSRAGPLPTSGPEEGKGSDYDETSGGGWEEPEFLCWHCWEYGPPPSPEPARASDTDQGHETDEDSPFLLSI
ncbi:hypothetical protein B0O99DRAFT_690666 [Bisporella sp. PMI_857]|nr:hypothetical protein B0O99DRAFT_690666 [Bisporella sp. PMI_857]